MSSPRHGAPSPAWRSLGPAGRESGAVHPVHAPSAARHACDNNATVHAARGKAGTDLPGVDRVVGHGDRSVPPQEPQSLWWQAAMPLRRYTCPLLVGCAPVFLAMSGATSALDADD